MSGIAEATPIRLTQEERAELEGLARSTRTECRPRRRARIVLLAADGMAGRAIGRAIGCATGAASSWRVAVTSFFLIGTDPQVRADLRAVCQQRNTDLGAAAELRFSRH